jgi:transcriptional regulator with XRE-family HTH domain
MSTDLTPTAGYDDGMPKMLSDGAVLARDFLESLDGPLTFGRMLRSIRDDEGASQAAYAERLGVPVQNISAIENGRRNVSAARASEWARTLRQDEALFVRLALQGELDAAGIALDVSVTGRPKARTTKRVVAAARAIRKGAPNLGYRGLIAQVAERLGHDLTQAEQESIYDALFAPKTKGRG